MKPPTRIHQLSIDGLEPAHVNSLLYRPIDDDDPGLIGLADSIRSYGVLEPLIVSRDRVIGSGHRRHAAARLARLETVPCLILPVNADHPDFSKLVVICNQQRVKNNDEILREVIAQLNPGEVYAALVQYRESRAQLTHGHKLEQITLREVKGRKKISQGKKPMLDEIKKILEANKQFWPLSDRQVHYRLLVCMIRRHAAKDDQVSRKNRKTGLIEMCSNIYINNAESYKDLTDLLTRARLNSLTSGMEDWSIPFEAIADETRTVVIWDVHQTPQSFLKRELDGFLKNYWRDLMASQPNHIEAVGEKLTIEGTISPILMKYTIPYTIGRGYASLDPRYKLVRRFLKSGKQKLILLFLSDFDPDGGEIAHSFARSLRDDFGLDERRIVPIQVALTAPQIAGLPAIMSAKTGSVNYDRFVAAHPDKVVHELDALTPAQLQQILTTAIESVIDRAAFEAELAKEEQDSVWVAGVRQTVLQTLRTAQLI